MLWIKQRHLVTNVVTPINLSECRKPSYATTAAIQEITTQLASAMRAGINSNALALGFELGLYCKTLLAPTKAKIVRDYRFLLYTCLVTGTQFIDIMSPLHGLAQELCNLALLWLLKLVHWLLRIWAKRKKILWVKPFGSCQRRSGRRICTSQSRHDTGTVF